MENEDAKNIDLETLVGERELSGVDRDTVQVPRYWPEDETEPAEALRFILDGVTYEAVEDPGDGYRNSMRHCRITETPVKNTFAPVKVVGRWRTKGEYSGVDEVLELLDSANGKAILEVGTSNIDDYYPSFEARWSPELMACNTRVE
jgi:hypothetical protein